MTDNSQEFKWKSEEKELVKSIEKLRSGNRTKSNIARETWKLYNHASLAAKQNPEVQSAVTEVGIDPHLMDPSALSNKDAILKYLESGTMESYDELSELYNDMSDVLKDDIYVTSKFLMYGYGAPETVASVIRYEPSRYETLPDNMKYDPIIVKEAVSQDVEGKIYRTLPDYLKTEEITKVAIEAVNDYNDWDGVKNFMKNDVPESAKTKEVCEFAVKTCGLAFSEVPKKYQTKELAEIAINNNGSAFLEMPKKFQTQELAYAAIRECPVNLCDDRSAVLKKFLTKEIAYEAMIMKQNPTDRSSDTYDFDYHIYEKLPEKLKADPKLAAIALDHRPERLENGVIPKVLTKDRKFMMEEIEKMPTYIPDHLPEELSSDSEFIKEVATRMLFITKDRIDEDYDTYVPHKKMVEDIHNIETAQDEANLIYDLYVERYTGPESNAKQEIYKEAALRHIKEEYLSGKYPDTLYENNVRALLASDKVFVIQAAEASEMPVEDMIDKYVPNEAKQHMRTEIIGIKDAAQKTEHKEYVIKDASEFSLDKFKEFEQKKYEQDKGIDSPEHENDVKSKPSNMYDENDGDHDAI